MSSVMLWPFLGTCPGQTRGFFGAQGSQEEFQLFKQRVGTSLVLNDSSLWLQEGPGLVHWAKGKRQDKNQRGSYLLLWAWGHCFLSEFILRTSNRIFLLEWGVGMEDWTNGRCCLWMGFAHCKIWVWPVKWPRVPQYVLDDSPFSPSFASFHTLHIKFP